MTHPAYKEWQVVIGALAAGEQILSLRKGGIAEGRAGFTVAAPRFWLFPTAFHQQLEKTKPGAARWFEPDQVADGTCQVQCFAEVHQAVFLESWERVAALDAFHVWTEATVRERFEWKKPPGVHALVLRVHRLIEPVQFELTPQMSGCKSWIDVPVAFDVRPSVPVLAEAEFNRRVDQLGLGN